MKKVEWTTKQIKYVLDLYRLGLSRKEIAVDFKAKFGVARSVDSIKHCLDTYGINIKRDMPKILLFDIETAPILAYTWGIWEQNIGLNQIKSDWHLLSWSAKWLGDPVEKVMYADQRDVKNIEDDSGILQKLWKLLDEADIVITQNGISFDTKKINARFIHHGFQPPSSYKHIDTKRIASRRFGFTSNKLEYMTDKLCTKYKKLKHSEFSGFELWRECMKGNLKAWKSMEKYNKYDVLSLEELYLKLQPWDNSINFNVYSNTTEYTCNCGSTSFRKSGFHLTKTAKFQKYNCRVCGAEHLGKENLHSKEKKSKLAL